VNNKMNDFVGTLLQNKFYAYCSSCYQEHADPHLSVALLCYLGATGAKTSLLLTALNSSHTIHAAH